MTPADRPAFLQVVLGFAELKGRQLSAPALELYWSAMQHWELAGFRAAAEELLRRSEFMPTPKDFEDLRRAGRMTAGEAWAIAREAIRYGYRSSTHPLIDRVVQILGGYYALGLLNSDQMPFLERRFAEHYEDLQDVEEVRQAVPQIASSSTLRRIAQGNA